MAVYYITVRESYDVTYKVDVSSMEDALQLVTNGELCADNELSADFVEQDDDFYITSPDNEVWACVDGVLEKQ